MSNTTNSGFSKVRSLLWPVHNFELKKLLPMFFMFFLISFNYTILRDTKDALIVTAPGSGAEAIPFLKLWGTLPFAILFMVVFSKLSNRLSKKNLFFASIAPFIIFFALFPTVIYPARDFLHPHGFADWLQSVLPSGFSGLVAIIRNWTFSLFYIMAELWGSVALSLLFWGFANDIMKVSEAKRFYSVLGLGANIALICSGPCIILATNIRASVPAGVDAWGVSLYLLMGMVAASGLIIMAIYNWIHKNVLTDPRLYDPTQVKQKKAKPKMGLLESFKYLAKSKYVGCLAILVIAYGISINLVEVTWKGQLKLQYPNPNDYTAFMGYFSMATGFVTSFMMLFVGGNMIRRFGWGTAAKFTPIVLLVTGGAFLSFILFRDQLTGMIAMLGTTPLFLAVIFGMIQNIMSKSSKYSLFDPTKEMAYIPLDQEQKVKGKAAIDVVGARLGKSGGSLLQMLLLVTFGSIGAMAPYVAGILVVIVAAWLLGVRYLNRQFTILTAAKTEAPAQAVKAETPLTEQATEKVPTS
jgi:AAA family ATP:ADP antiporter